MHCFFVPAALLQENEVTLTDQLAHQLSHVLRLSRGEHVVLLDGLGGAYEAELQEVAPHRATARIVKKSFPRTEPRLRLILYQALPKGKKMDWVLQKGTELGVSAFVPMTTERSIVQNPARIGKSRIARWQRIVTEAAEQSGRAYLPQVMPVQQFVDVCQQAPEGALALVASMGADVCPRPLRQALEVTPFPQEVWLFIGPEGGFTLGEVQSARQAGMIPISLGPRILRTETAGLAAAAIIFYAFGEL